MAKYGSAGREQVSDPNAGYTGVEVEESQAREGVAHDKLAATQLVRQLNEQVRSIPASEQLDVGQVSGSDNMLNAGINALAASIAGAAEEIQGTWREEVTNKLALKAQAEQGTAIAITSIAQTKKRSPFMAAVFGQTVTSRIAEAQSIQNATTALSNQMNEDMPVLAEMETGAAIDYMTNAAEDLVKSIKDPEMQQTALDNLLIQMPALADAHHKERFALMRNKQILNNKEHIIGSRVKFEHDKKRRSQPEEKALLLQAYAQDLFKPNDPTGQQQDPASLREQRSLVIAQAKADLANGNMTMYTAMMSLPEGAPNKLTEVEMDGFADAIGKFDTDHNTSAQHVLSTAALGLMEATTAAEAKSIAHIARTNLAQWTREGTQSEKDQINQMNRKVQLETAIRADAGTWAATKVAEDRLNLLNNATNMGTAERADLEGNMTKKEKQYVSNRRIPELISQKSGMPIDQATELGLSVLTDGLHYKDANGERHMSGATFGMLLARDLADSAGPVPDIVQNYVDMTLNGMAVGRGIDGIATPEQEEAFRVAEAFVSGISGIKMDADEKVHFAMMRRGFNSKTPPEAVEAQYKNYIANKGKTDPSTKTLKEKRANVKGIVMDVMKGQQITDRTMADYNQEWDEILTSVNYDTKIAEAVFRQGLYNSSSVVMGMKVPNGRALNEALGTEYGLDALLKQMSNTTEESEFGQNISAITPMMKMMFGTSIDSDQKQLTDGTRLMLSGIEYIPGDDSVKFTVIGGGVRRVTLDHLRDANALVVASRKRNDAVKAVHNLMNESGIVNASNAGLPDKAKGYMDQYKTISILAAKAASEIYGRKVEEAGAWDRIKDFFN